MKPVGKKSPASIAQPIGVVVEPANERTGRPVKFASAHDLRRTFAQRLRNKGVAPLLISVVMRRASWETTSKHYAPGEVQQDADGPRGGVARVRGNGDEVHVHVDGGADGTQEVGHEDEAAFEDADDEDEKKSRKPAS